MADQAEVYVKNLSTEDVIVNRNGSTLPAIGEGEVRGVLGFTIGECLIINPPKGVWDNYVMFNSEIDLDLICSRTESCWEIRIKPNNLGQLTPTTVNVTIGDN